MIITVDEVKTLLEITGTSKDKIIENLIPLVQDFVLTYCNNEFLISNRYYIAGSIAFVEGDPPTITDSESYFETAKFTDGMHLKISGSVDND